MADDLDCNAPDWHLGYDHGLNDDPCDSVLWSSSGNYRDGYETGQAEQDAPAAFRGRKRGEAAPVE